MTRTAASREGQPTTAFPLQAGVPEKGGQSKRQNAISSEENLKLREKYSIEIRTRISLLQQRIFGAQGERLCPRRVIFIHIPKTAGSSVNTYFKGLLGSSWRGQAVTLSSPFVTNPMELALAKRARFVGGHVDASMLALIRGDAFAFTLLRDPLERIASAWRFFQTHRRPELRLPFPTLQAALASDHPRVRHVFGNVIACQLAGAQPGRSCRSDGERIVDRARATLASLDAVAWQHSFDTDFPAVLWELGLLPPLKPLRVNVTDDPLRPGRDRHVEMPAIPSRHELVDMAAPWTALDVAVTSGWRADRKLRTPEE